MKYLKIFKKFFENGSLSLDSLNRLRVDMFRKTKQLVILCLIDMLDDEFEIETTADDRVIVKVMIRRKLKNTNWSSGRPGFLFDESIISFYTLLKKTYNVSIVVDTPTRTAREGQRLPSRIVLGNLDTFYSRSVFRTYEYVEYNNIDKFLNQLRNVYIQTVQVYVTLKT